MPYIDQDAADTLHKSGNPRNPGELNYALSVVIANYLQAHGLSYSTLNDISGAMTEALAEFRRRIVVPYEDVKRASGVDPYVYVRPAASEPDTEWAERLRKDPV